jgi:single-strand DNA-binding protein
MLNQIILVGRLTKDLEVKEGENGSKYANLCLAIPRSWKNAEGQYDTDFVECKAFESIATNTSEYCRKGDIVGVKGRIQTDTIEKEDGTKEFKMSIIAEKVTFLSSKSKNEE